VHPALRLAYGAAGQLARAAAVIAPPGDAKWRRALRARQGIRRRYAAYAPRRDPARPLLWMHAPSVGEGLQAREILELVRARRPDVQLAFTFFSPSAADFAAALDVDFADYLPFDTAADAGAALDALRPTALVFSKVDAWPILVGQAVRRGVRLGLVSGTMSEASTRQGVLARHLLRECYRCLHRVGAVADGDAARLVALGVAPERIVVTGDTRFDQVWRRAARADLGGPLLRPMGSDRPTLVAGSTWPSDEDVLLPAWLRTRRTVRGARLIIAPHEPGAADLARLEQWAVTSGLRAARFRADDVASADVIVVDRVGVLGDLYALATVAYVGGGFHSAGLHSVLEPAAYGVPVVFGPRHGNSREATLLVRAGGGRAVTDSSDAAECLVSWLGEPDARQGAGSAAREVVRAGTGASERTFDLVMGLLGLHAAP
jgi:3-deoxy-D-manno-octulosonic-acid transferase